MVDVAVGGEGQTADVETTTDPAEQEEIPDGTEDYG